jgi:hypothetical protein
MQVEETREGIALPLVRAALRTHPSQCLWPFHKKKQSFAHLCREYAPHSYVPLTNPA